MVMLDVMTTSMGDNIKAHNNVSKKFVFREPPQSAPTTSLKNINNSTDKSLPRTLQKPNSDVKDLTQKLKNLSLNDFKTKSLTATTTSSCRYGSAGTNCQSLDAIAQKILSGQVKNIVIMAGAGISTASGIPDFRSPGTGLYDNLQQYSIPYPEAVFDADYFERNPQPFYSLAKDLYPSCKYQPNVIHYFLRLLSEKGNLLRIYTQNIDGLEKMAGLPSVKVIEAHGSFETASCTRCKLHYPTDDIKETIKNGKLPRCKKSTCWGLVKPDIVFFGEDLPRRFYFYLRDFPQADLLLVMGTSLEVEPFAGIIDSVRLFVPRVLFNRTAVGPFQYKRRINDSVITGDILENIKKLTSILGWKDDMDSLIKAEKELWENDQDKIMSRLKPPKQPSQAAWISPSTNKNRQTNLSQRNNKIQFNRNQSKWGLNTSSRNNSDDSSISSSSCSSSSTSSSTAGASTKKIVRRPAYKLPKGGASSNPRHSAKSQPTSNYSGNKLIKDSRITTSSHGIRSKAVVNRSPSFTTMSKLSMQSKPKNNLSPVVEPPNQQYKTRLTGQHLVTKQREHELQKRREQQQKVLRHLKPPIAPKISYQHRNRAPTMRIGPPKPWRFNKVAGHTQNNTNSDSDSSTSGSDDSSDSEG